MASVKRHEEYQYLEIIQDILDRGNKKGDRTGTGTLSVFGRQMRFSLRDGTFPLLTTKKTFYRGIAEELFWFIRGSTNAHELRDKKGFHDDWANEKWLKFFKILKKMAFFNKFQIFQQILDFFTQI